MSSGASPSSCLRCGEGGSSFPRGDFCSHPSFSMSPKPLRLLASPSCQRQLTSLELQYVSPKLLMCRDLELAVPGTYDPNQQIIRIQSIAPSLQVITSKQRPRKLTLMGEKLALDKQRSFLGLLPSLLGFSWPRPSCPVPDVSITGFSRAERRPIKKA